ncbi:helix-turn-helix domain-containing protein [Limosilactobacillus reuteri]|uniref:helix-turn-helix domain-containing protein n=1 Tax=Limosilactobacillus reuteri TaxID=1598 RepID=UPI001E4F637E|nr:helix-turn-helix transcriptional regulator [Limosilactobacillus reuteri]MCC4440708.1 helix-turn-helix domain-containing protein [Limosilactobacillus reuteri]
MNIGDNIKKYRVAAGLTQQELAEKGGLSINFVSRIEWSNNQNISLKNLAKLDKALNVPLANLVKNDQNRNNPNVEKLVHLLYSLDVEQANTLSQSFLTIINSFNK